MVRGTGRRFTRQERLDRISDTLRLRAKGWTQQRIAEHLDVRQTTVQRWLKQYWGTRHVTVQQNIAAAIRAELVCCSIYQRMEDAGGDTEEWRKLRHGVDYHDICFFGEWAARIAEKITHEPGE
jgi:transcriptional regulator with XRE-family HTH domain